MTYTLNEGTLAVQPSEDRSINVLTLARPEGGAPVTLVITRDACAPGEDLAASLTRQLRTLSRQMQAFKEHSRESFRLGTAALPAIAVETSFRQGGQPFYQCQALAQRPGGELLIFTLTSPTPIDAPLHEEWRRLLASFTPA